MNIKRIHLQALDARRRRSSLLFYLKHLSELREVNPAGGRSRPVVAPESSFLVIGAAKTGKTTVGRLVQKLWPQAQIMEQTTNRQTEGRPDLITNSVELSAMWAEASLVIVTFTKPNRSPRPSEPNYRLCARIVKNRWHKVNPEHNFWITGER